MTTVAKLKKILEILEKNGLGNELVAADHDIIFLSSAPADAPFGDDLEEAGASYSGGEGWYVFV